MRGKSGLFLAVFVGLLSGPERARAEKHTDDSLAAIILPRKGTVLVYYADDALGEYGARDGKLVRTFDIRSKLTLFAASTDEKALAMVGRDGSVTLWGLEAGRRRWTEQAPVHPTYFIWDICFSQDGTTLVVAGSPIVVYDARSGAVKRLISQEGLDARSAALSPDGKTGVASSKGGDLRAFDVGTGKAEKIGRRGFGPVRYASDGRHVACLSKGAEDYKARVALRVVSLTRGFPFKDVGDYWRITYLQPTSDGAFNYHVAPGFMHGIGMRYDPRTGRVTKLWDTPEQTFGTGGAFSSEAMVLVHTDFKLTTHITDLRTGRAIEIDNSARWLGELRETRTRADLPPYEKLADPLPELPPGPPVGGPASRREAPSLVWTLWVAGALAAVVLAGVIWGAVRRRKRASGHPGAG
jgi:hypothetical protein